MGRRRFVTIVATCLAAAVLCAQLAQLTTLRGQDTDLYPRWYGLRQLLLHGRNPYGDDVSREVASQIWFFDGHVSAPGSGPATALERIYGFLYPLPGMLLLAPLALLPYQVAYALWVLGMLVALPAAAWMAMDVAGRSAAARSAGNAVPPPLEGDVHGGRGWRVALAALLALVFLPTWADVMLGQLAPATALLTALAVWLRNPFGAGAALAAAVAVKPHLLALLAPLWLAWHSLNALRGSQRSRHFLAGAVCAGATLAAAALLALPSWPADFFRAARDYAAVGPGEAAVLVAARTLLPESAALPAAAVLGGAALVWALTAWWHAVRDDARVMAAVWRTLLVSALVLPPAWETNAVMLLLPLAAAVGEQPARRPALVASGASAALTFLLLPPYFMLGWQRGTLVIASYVVLSWVLAELPSLQRRPKTWSLRRADAVPGGAGQAPALQPRL